MTNFLLLLILFLISLCLGPIAQADPLFISAFLTAEQEYTDNLYQTPFDATKEFVSYVGAGATIGLKTKKNYLDLNYKLRKVKYWDYEGDDPYDTTLMNYVDHNLGLNASTFITSRLKVGLYENFLRGRRLREYYFATNRISRALYWDNRISPYIEYRLGKKLFLNLKYQYDVLRYAEEEEVFLTEYDQDSTEHRGGLTTEYRFNPRNSVDLAYQYWTRDYQAIIPEQIEFSSYQAHQVTLGYKRQLSPIIEAEVRGGYQTRNYEEEVEGRVEDWQGFIYSLSSRAKTKKSSASLSFEQTQGDLADIGGGYYTTRMLRGDIGHTFLGKISLSLNGYYQQVRYDEYLVRTEAGAMEERKDDIWSIGPKVEYPISRWLLLGFQFQHIDRETNDVVSFFFGDYVENRILFAIRPRYEIKR